MLSPLIDNPLLDLLLPLGCLFPSFQSSSGVKGTKHEQLATHDLTRMRELSPVAKMFSQRDSSEVLRDSRFAVSSDKEDFRFCRIGGCKSRRDS